MRADQAARSFQFSRSERDVSIRPSTSLRDCTKSPRLTMATLSVSLRTVQVGPLKGGLAKRWRPQSATKKRARTATPAPAPAQNLRSLVHLRDFDRREEPGARRDECWLPFKSGGGLAEDSVRDGAAVSTAGLCGAGSVSWASCLTGLLWNGSDWGLRGGACGISYLNSAKSTRLM